MKKTIKITKKKSLISPLSIKTYDIYYPSPCRDALKLIIDSIKCGIATRRISH